MRVRCIAELPTEEQAKRLGRFYAGTRQSFGVTIGMEYLVFGLRVVEGSVLLDIPQDFEQLYPVPLCLFEITDPRVPSLWSARLRDDGSLLLWPPSFFEREYYHQDLLERVPSVLEDFERVRRRLEVESAIGAAQ